MKARQLILSTIIIVLLLLPTQVLARTWTSMPEAEWSYTDPIVEEGFYDYITSSSTLVRNSNLYYFSNNRLHIVNTNTGKHKASIDYLGKSNMGYSFFGLFAQVDNKGNAYMMTATRNSSGNDVYKITAYNDTGKKLWEKAYNEKIRANAGLFVLNNGNIVTYLETASEKIVTYTYDSKGQLKDKREWKSFIQDYKNGYIVTRNIIGKHASRFAFYDDSMKLKFAINFNHDEGYYAGITPEGLVVFYKYNSATGKATFFAKDQTGKKVWSKEFAGQAGQSTFFNENHVGEGAFTKFGVKIGKQLFLIDRKGTMQKLTFGDFEFQTASDQTLMLYNKKKIEIYKASDLSLLHSITLSNANKMDKFLYAGAGIVYRIDEKNVISKINVAKA
ncbi:hypothetical protein [Paenibacillus gorillae]|uniref:hypothetical protein n=1 Tax=Paenibacillus gorillae TaxID=1243662 RepID=UPI0004B8C343|nr:hypothetical protein [Paenibacillus gorillae]